ncbi:MAG: alpha/beta fold hydrolase [Verrucomicrobiaceae bacterium]|nr:alpha/beta fold hydrolase [Verrucomicrobiaceae bacterium]
MNLYYLDSSNRPVGPITEADIPDLYARQVIGDETLMAADGGDGWFPLRTILADDEAPPAASRREAAPVKAKPKPMMVSWTQSPAPSKQPPSTPPRSAAPAARRASPPAVVPRPVFDPPPSLPRSMPAHMPGIGRIAFFALSAGWLLLSVLITFMLLGGMVAVALSKQTDATAVVRQFSALNVLISGVMWLAFSGLCVLRARNIGWSATLVGIFTFVLVPLAPLIWLALQVLPPGFRHTRRLDVPGVVWGGVLVVLFLALGLSFMSAFLKRVAQAESTIVWDQRRTHVTHLIRKGPSPQTAENDEPPEGVVEVKYPSGDLSLKAWYAKPKLTGRQPALVYFHGGYAFGEDDFDDVRDFLDAGFAVMTPMLRGENGNPGIHEHHYGELDDAEAAIRWIKQQPEVDPARVFTFGHSAGGVLSVMVSFNDKNAVLLTGSAGGMYDATIFRSGDARLPFDANDPLECNLRAPAPNAGFIVLPHIAYVGSDDALVVQGANLARVRASKTRAPLTIKNVPGDHGGMLEPAMKDFLQQAKLKAGF